MIRRVRLFVALHVAAVFALYLLAWTVGHAVLPEPIPAAPVSRPRAAAQAVPAPVGLEAARSAATASLSWAAERRSEAQLDALPERVELSRWAVDVAAR